MITVTVNGLPAPQGSKRPVGNGRMIESSKAVGPWREAVRTETQKIIAASSVEELRLHWQPVAVAMLFRLPRPKGHTSARGGLRLSAPIWPATRPDLDKLARAVGDGIVAGGAIADDAQVCRLLVEKEYADGQPPGVTVTIEALP